MGLLDKCQGQRVRQREYKFDPLHTDVTFMHDIQSLLFESRRHFFKTADKQTKQTDRQKLVCFCQFHPVGTRPVSEM